MESKLSDIFTTYANADIKNNPQVFLKIKNVFKKNVRSKANLDWLNMIIKYFVILTKIDNLEKAEAIYNKFINKKFRTMKGHVKFRHSFKIAFDGIYGYRNNYCEDGFCITAYNTVIATDGLKCYECEQHNFRRLLIDIVLGYEYSQIGVKGFFNDLLKYSYHNFARIIEISKAPSDSEFSQDLVERIYFDPDREFFQADLDGRFRSDFHDIFLKDMVAISLCDFLLNDDRRKLKWCVRCFDYFIQTKLNPKQKYCPSCSRKSRMSKKERNEYQRKYRQRIKQEKLVIQKRETVNRLLSEGWTRKEAEEIIEADLMK